MKDAAFWESLDDAQAALLAKFASPGVTRVEFIVGLGDSDSVWPWLGTATDAERDALAAHQDLEKEVNEVLLVAGLQGSGGVTVQSEETVARDYEGSWFYAMR